MRIPYPTSCPDGYCVSFLRFSIKSRSKNSKPNQPGTGVVEGVHEGEGEGTSGATRGDVGGELGCVGGVSGGLEGGLHGVLEREVQGLGGEVPQDVSEIS